MHVPGGMRTIMTGAEVLAGAAGAALLAKRVLKRPEVAGLPTEMAIGLGLAAAALFAGSEYGKDLMALAAGALAVPVASKALEAAGGAQIAGWPYYQVGQLPEGAVYALPPGQTGAASMNLATQIAGLT